MLFMALLLHTKSFAAENPIGWNPQYVNATCLISRQVEDPKDAKKPWTVKMGYVKNEKQLVFIFSFANEGFKNLKLSNDIKAYLNVDGELFEAIGITAKNSEILTPVSDSKKLQKKLQNAKLLGVKIDKNNTGEKLAISAFELENISSAVNWLNDCNIRGISSLPSPTDQVGMIAVQSDTNNAPAAANVPSAVPKNVSPKVNIPDFEISAKDLINEFKDNNFAATLKYKNKKVLVKGIVKNVEPTKFQEPESVKIALAEQEGDFYTFDGVLVPSKEQIAEAIKIKKGDYIQLLCDGGVSFSMSSVEGDGCQLTNVNSADQTGPASNVEALSFSLRFNTPEKNKLISDYSGKRVRTKIFIEKFEDRNNTRIMHDANSDFLCSVNMVDVASFPSKKGQYEVEGIFVVIDGKPALSRCKFVQKVTK
jgi:hypothetical protein